MFQSLKSTVNSCERQRIPQLPKVNSQKQFVRHLKSENTFLLSKMGVSKSNFVNFRLKIRQQAQKEHRQNSQKRQRKGLNIPLLSYNGNDHSPLKQTYQKREHPLLVSRSKQFKTSTPSIGIYDTSGLQKVKFKKSHCVIMPSALKQELFNLR